MVILWNPIAIEAVRTEIGHGGSADYKGALRLFIKPRDERRDVHACNDHEQSACCDNSLLAPYMFHNVPAPIVYDSSNLPAPTMAPKAPTMAPKERRGVKRRAEQDAVEAEGPNEVLEEDLQTPVKIKFDKTPSVYSDPAKKSQCIALWKRTARGEVQKASQDDIDNAQKALQVMKELPQ